MARTLLLADDSNTIRKIVELTFAGTDIRVVAAASGSEALTLLESARPDLLLADVVMPEPDGYALCRAVKDSDRPLPVILLAGTFEPFDRRRAWDSGADDHLVKPFESQLLRAKVEACLDGRGPRSARMVATGLEEQPPAHAESEAAPIAAAAPAAPAALGPAEIDAVAQRVIERLTSETVASLVRESLPEIAERVVRERIRELEALEESRRS